MTEQLDDDDAEVERPWRRTRRVPTRRSRDYLLGDFELGDWADVPEENAAHWDARVWRDRPIR